MSRKNQIDRIGVGYWMFALVVTWLPLVNLIAIPLLAIFSSHPSKRNFYKAHIVFFLIIIGIILAIAGTGIFIGAWETVQEKLKEQQGLPIPAEETAPPTSARN